MLEERVKFSRGERLAEDDPATHSDGPEPMENWPLRVQASGMMAEGESRHELRPLMEKHHSCLNTRAIIEYFQENLPEEMSGLFAGLGPEIEGLANPQEFLMEVNNWVSSDVVTKMFENAKRITQNNQIAFKIGFESAARKKLGYVQRIILFSYKNPRQTLKRVQAINDKFNRNKTIELVEVKRDSAVVRLHWFKNIPANRDFCLFNQGNLLRHSHHLENAARNPGRNQMLLQGGRLLRIPPEMAKALFLQRELVEVHGALAGPHLYHRGAGAGQGTAAKEVR